MKKIELHVHLDGCVRPKTASEILKMDEKNTRKMMMVEKENKDLKQYLTKFNLPIQIMQNEENISRISKEMVEDLKKDEVIYAEIRFAPLLHTKKGLTYEKIIDSVLKGINHEKDIKTNLILCLMRGATFEENLETIKCAKKYLNKGVVGLDLAGDEKKYKTKDYEKLFKIAKEEKIPFTIHSGEADGKDSINSAIEFGAKRLGHGIRCLEDEELIKKINKENITLEICPTSNIQTKVIDSYQNYPIRKLMEKGIKITINTDNRTVSNITLKKEYELLKKHLKITNEDLINFNINAINASFMKTEEKQKYIDLIKKEQLKKHKNKK